MFGAQARFPGNAVDIRGQSSQYVRVADSGRKLTFHFCPQCGATVHYRIEGMGDIVAIPVVAFADPTFPAPRFSVYEARKHAWVGVPDDIEHTN